MSSCQSTSEACEHDKNTTKEEVLSAALTLIAEDADALSWEEIREIAQEALDKARALP